MSVPAIILAIIAIIVGVGIGYFIRKSIFEKQLDAAKKILHKESCRKQKKKQRQPLKSGC